MNDSIEARLDALGLTLPVTEGESYYGAAYGTMKPFHITGSVLHLSGHVPIRSGVPLHPPPPLPEPSRTFSFSGRKNDASPMLARRLRASSN